MYVFLRKWYWVYGNIPETFTLNHLYKKGLEVGEGLSFKLTQKYMTGLIRDFEKSTEIAATIASKTNPPSNNATGAFVEGSNENPLNSQIDPPTITIKKRKM